jgi:L-lactate dehydrogenase (cytochrome)
MAAGSWTAQGHHSTNWPKSSMPWETGVDVLMDGGVQRGTHVLKALSVGAKAVGIGRYYLYPLAAAGQAGVERALGLMQTEIERDMKLMGCTAFSELSRDNLRFR